MLVLASSPRTMSRLRASTMSLSAPPASIGKRTAPPPSVKLVTRSGVLAARKSAAGVRRLDRRYWGDRWPIRRSDGPGTLPKCPVQSVLGGHRNDRIPACRWRQPAVQQEEQQNEELLRQPDRRARKAIQAISTGQSDGLANQAGDEVDRARDDSGAEHIRQQGVGEHCTPDPSITDRGVGHLVTHADGEGNIGEVAIGWAPPVRPGRRRRSLGP